MRNCLSEGIKHLNKERDGRTTITNLDGVPCRYLNRAAENKWNGFLYFALHPDFKARQLTAARVEIEYFVRNPTFFRLQYDGMQGETPKPYKSTLAENEATVKFGTAVTFSRARQANAWQTATFRLIDGVFLNSQNGGADFRLEVTPADIYVRRVTVTRDDAEPLRPRVP